VARIFDSRKDGPEWPGNLGYRGRPSLRILLDGEDIAHSYAKARYEQTGKWTGPLSQGIEEAFMFGGWSGGQPEDPNPNRTSEDLNFQSPELLVFVAMPADLIEAINPAHLCDGYPEKVRKEQNYVQLHEDGYFVNTYLTDLQEQSRLITWSRPGRLRGGYDRPNALITQKYYQQGAVHGIPRSLKQSPIMLTQCMGTGFTVKIGDEVEALKPGKLVFNGWMPSRWEEAEVKAVNYDGTYDVQFKQKFGPVREHRSTIRGLQGKVQLSLAKNEVYKENWGADTMPAAFRMMQEMNYAQALPPSSIRLKGSLDPLSDTMDNEANQDWYLCSSKDFILTCQQQDMESRRRLIRFKSEFQFDYKWVPTPEGGLRFVPIPNKNMILGLNTTHKDAEGAGMSVKDEARWRRLKKVAAGLEENLEDLSKVNEPKPLDVRPSGPRPRVPLDELPELETVEAEPGRAKRRSLAQELARDALADGYRESGGRPTMAPGFDSRFR